MSDFQNQESEKIILLDIELNQSNKIKKVEVSCYQIAYIWVLRWLDKRRLKPDYPLFEVC